MTVLTVVDEVVEAVPMALPAIPVVETERDLFARNRDRVAAALRANGERQIVGALTDAGGGVCFVGCAAEVVE